MLSWGVLSDSTWFTCCTLDKPFSTSFSFFLPSHSSFLTPSLIVVAVSSHSSLLSPFHLYIFYLLSSEFPSSFYLFLFFSLVCCECSAHALMHIYVHSYIHTVHSCILVYMNIRPQRRGLTFVVISPCKHHL